MHENAHELGLLPLETLQGDRLIAHLGVIEGAGHEAGDALQRTDISRRSRHAGTALPVLLGDLPPESPALAGNVGALQEPGTGALTEFAGLSQGGESEETRLLEDGLPFGPSFGSIIEPKTYFPKRG
jgi:hypothetical protein